VELRLALTQRASCKMLGSRHVWARQKVSGRMFGPRHGCAGLKMNVVRIWPSPSTDTSVQAGWQSYGLAGLEPVKLGDGWRHRSSRLQHRDTLLRQHLVDETLDGDGCKGV
jgi:hypothetical protein